MNGKGSNEGVKMRYQYDQWPPIEASGRDVIGTFLPELTEAHALSLEGRDPNGLHGVSERHICPDDPNVRVLVDVLTLPTSADARTAILHALTRCTAPQLPLGEERGLSIGEVSFCGLGDPIAFLMFVRRNVFVTVRSVGATIAAAPAIAATIDAQLLTRVGGTSATQRPGTVTNAAVARYDDLFSRDNFGDTGVVPSTGNPCQSPDIIPLQDHALGWPQVEQTYNGPDLGLPIVNGGVNNVYVRAKNLNTSRPSSGGARLYYSRASVLLLPSTWTQVTGPSGQGELPLVNAEAGTSIAAGDVAVSSPAFLLTGLPPTSGDHFCFVSVIQTPSHTVTVPTSFASNAAFAQWVQTNPAVAWRNISIVGNGQTQIVRAFQFGSTNPDGAYFYFSFVGNGFPTGTGISVQCTDAANPIQWSGALPAPDAQGSQLTGFQHWVIGNFSSAVVVTLTSPSGAFPSGAKVSFKYYQVPATDDALHRSVGRLVRVVQVHNTLGPQTIAAFLVPLGECTLVVH